MRVWLITVGEPLPLPGARDRPWRTGMLAALLAERGHEVLWWTSSVDHFGKAFFVPGEPRVRIAPGLTIQFLAGRLYRRNVSLSRLLNHIEIGRRFTTRAADEERPDLILASFPTIELSREAVRYGRRWSLPVILDVRDLWPDIFLDAVPARLRFLGNLALRRLQSDAAGALAECDAIFAVSEGYLRWGLSKGKRARSPMDAVYPLGYQRGEWVASDQFALEARLRACRVDPRATLVAFVGTFGRSYDLGTVIEAAGRMTASADCDAQFVLCGRGERESEWRRAADGISRVAFLGWLPAGELAYLLARSAAGLAAYEPEAPQGIPNKIIEYLSAGLPILSTLSGETKSLLDSSGCGLYYPPRDAGALVGLVQDLLRDSVRRAAMGTAARALFDERFSALAVYGAMADHLEMLVRRIEDRGSSPGGSALQREPSRVRW